jgi:hypothetical protein
MIGPHVPSPSVRGPHRILPKMAYRGYGVGGLLQGAPEDPRIGLDAGFSPLG